MTANDVRGDAAGMATTAVADVLFARAVYINFRMLVTYEINTR